MIKKLKIKDFALIDDLEIDFSNGLNVLTGETGAGKTIILEALFLLFGKRADPLLVRYQKDQAIVSGIFVLNEKLREELKVSELEIVREISSDAKNNITINGISTPLFELKKIMKQFMSIHSQDETLNLVMSTNYVSFIDKVDQKKSLELYNKYQFERSKYLDKLTKYHSLLERKKEASTKSDFLAYQINELDKLDLKADEDDLLSSEIEKLKNFDTIKLSLEKVILDFEGDIAIIDLIYSSFKGLEKIASFDSKYESYLKTMSDSYYGISDLLTSINKELRDLDFDSEYFNSLLERSYTLAKIKEKYQMGLNDLINYHQKIKEELSILTDYDGYLKKAQEELEILKKKAFESGNELSLLREKLAKKLTSDLLNELKELDLPKVDFLISFTKSEELLEDGIDHVEFFISLNEGEPKKPLTKVASGGERARFLFALKSLYANYNDLSILIFDEIDAGISGKVAAKMASRMVELSKRFQLVVITHLPQIAARANTNFGITKIHDGSRMKTIIKKLSEEEKVMAIALMLSDEVVSHHAISQAQEMIKK